VGLVLLAHLGVQQTVSRIQEGWVQDDATPARLKVALVREIELKAPPAPAARPAARPPAAHTGLLAPEPPASAPAPEKLEALPEAKLDLPAPIASAPVPDGEPGPEWPLSTRLEYALVGNYRGPIHGQAQVEWLRKGADYQMHLDVSVGPSFAPLMTRRSSSYGRLTPDGIRPDRYEEETQAIIGQKRRAVVRFEGGNVLLANNVIEPALPGAQDQVSQFVHLTWLFLTGRQPPQAGLAIDQGLVLTRRQYPARYAVLGEENVETPMGLLPTWHVKPTREVGGGDFTVEFWSAPAVQYLPVKLRLALDADTWIELTLKGRPLQAAPETESLSVPLPTDPPRERSR
jgi:hypothetical protein